MSLVMNRQAASARFYDTIAKIADSKPTLLLQQAMPLGNKFAFRVTGSHAPYKQALAESDYGDMIIAATNSQFRLYPGTIQPISPINNQIIVSAIIEANTQVKDYDAGYVEKNMRVLTANVFIDNADNQIWRVVEQGDQKYLIQSVKEDYSALLAARLARRAPHVVSAANYTGQVPMNGDYILYYDPEKSALAWGFAITSSDKGLLVCERQTKQAVPINSAHVVAVAAGDTIKKKYSMAEHITKEGGANMLAEEITPSALTAFLDYMRNLYANTDFFSQLEKLINARRSQPKLIDTYNELS